MKNHLVILCILSTAAFSGCGGDDDDSSMPPAQVPPTEITQSERFLADIQGTWEGCITEDDISYTLNVTFTDTRLDYVLDEYLSDDCTGDIDFSETAVQSIAIGDAVTTSGGTTAYEVDFTIVESEFDDEGSMFFDIVAVSNGLLFFGLLEDDDTGSTAENRATALDTDNPLMPVSN